MQHSMGGGDDTFTQKQNGQTNTTQNSNQLHRYTLCLSPWFLFNFEPMLSSRHVKGVSEQHMESECLLQQPEEEDHWIRSQELLLAP